jgi:hypothetical protein
MIDEDTYNRLLENSPVKQRFHQLFQRFPPSVQVMIVHKYSGIFNHYTEIGDDQVVKMCDHLEYCLWTVQDEALYNAYKEII